MAAAARELDRRAKRTREEITSAFDALVLERRYDAIRTIDLIAKAGIGRSTFYEHFKNKDDVLVAAMEPILLPLANAASGRASHAAIRMMLAHMWKVRALGRVLLDSPARPKLVHRLAEMIVARLEIDSTAAIPAKMPATAAATGQFSVLRMWLAGEVACPIDELATQMLAFSKLADR